MLESFEQLGGEGILAGICSAVVVTRKITQVGFGTLLRAVILAVAVLLLLVVVIVVLAVVVDVWLRFDRTT